MLIIFQNQCKNRELQTLQGVNQENVESRFLDRFSGCAKRSKNESDFHYWISNGKLNTTLTTIYIFVLPRPDRIFLPWGIRSAHVGGDTCFSYLYPHQNGFYICSPDVFSTALHRLLVHREKARVHSRTVQGFINQNLGIRILVAFFLNWGWSNSSTFRRAWACTQDGLGPPVILTAIEI